MEIRLKYSYSGLLLFAVVTIGLIVAGFLYTRVFWIFAACLVPFIALFILDAVKYGKDALVINDKGFWVDGEFEMDWRQVDHCYVCARAGEHWSNEYYLVIVTKGRVRHAICLERYIYNSIFCTKKLTKDINQLMGKEICYMTADDKEYEKQFRQPILTLLLIMVAFVLLTYLIVSLAR